MIKKVIVKDLQKHKKLIIKFTSGLNTIVSGNDNGKSSIIRGFYWLCFNKPAGEWMRRYGSTVTKFKMINDKGSVTRVKGDKINRYIVDNDEKFDNFGFTVPQAIQDQIQFTLQDFNGKDMSPNIALQDELPFMIHEPATVKAALLNKLTGIDLLEDCTKSFQKDINVARKDKRSATETIKSCKSDIKALPKTKPVRKAIKIVTKLMDKAHALTDVIGQLTELRTQVISINKQLKRATKLSKVKIEWLEEAAIKLFVFGEHIESIKEARDKYSEVHDQHEVPDIDFKSMEDSLAEAVKLDEIHTSLVKEHVKYGLLRESITVNNSLIEDEKKFLDKHKDAVCETCGRPL